jgi:exosome complex component RRP43
VFKSQDVRPDGRGLQKFRPVSINVGSIRTAEGSAIVKIGNTTVVCGIKAVSRMFSVLIHIIVFI